MHLACVRWCAGRGRGEPVRPTRSPGTDSRFRWRRVPGRCSIRSERTFRGAQGLVPQTLDEQTVLSYVRRVPVSLLKEVLLTGMPEDVIGQAAEWRDHRLRYLVVCNVSILQPSLRKGLAATAPFFKILRGLKKL